LLVGVSEHKGRADELLGVATKGKEIKTGIASSIATNITPSPPFQIREIAHPINIGRRICIVRVRRSTKLHLLMTKGVNNPIYIRNEDQSIPADAGRLQALLAARVASQESDPNSVYATNPMEFIYLNVTKRPLSQNGIIQHDRRKSETFLCLRIRPTEQKKVHLDRAVEQEFSTSVESIFHFLLERIGEEVLNPLIAITELHLRDWYQISYTDDEIGHQKHWARQSIRLDVFTMLPSLGMYSHPVPALGRVGA
jgi:predicted HTH transcriptional regulator